MTKSAQLSRDARAPTTHRGYSESAAADKQGQRIDTSAKWTFEWITDRLGLLRDHVTGIIGRKR